ncbi:hypothetical protein GCM10022378_19630 [Salinicoccus jeotgali]|uniref:Ribosomal protein L7/L12 C-terminal domain-containing protein n=1 Tax=Salinicoccus jeotgali TaxID=381634 RepID=A0ABP7F7T5_9STAP
MAYIIPLLLGIIVYLLYTNSKLNGEVRRLKSGQEKFITADGEGHPVDHELRRMVREGEEIKAIKKARQTLGLSLVEGKQYVDRLKRE